ncbi:hypothetical protein PTTG_12562 [Puccinia triticina 1-1 BBBD Race 1]|uniref:Uncharacterized protein n=1 Tax=Puccinia triticina (isolate 1-1 / race 1 (BBBD)) TaxID=630390 RepID=A0A180GPB3_PUCT1|nr:hypothetical protein PTTG_12562 [Puccinia triticina 1-1 BBBD Race 1]
MSPRSLGPSNLSGHTQHPCHPTLARQHPARLDPLPTSPGTLAPQRILPLSFGPKGLRNDKTLRRSLSRRGVSIVLMGVRKVIRVGGPADLDRPLGDLLKEQVRFIIIHRMGQPPEQGWDWERDDSYGSRSSS